MELNKLVISPLELSTDDFLNLKELNLVFLLGPGDPSDQTVEEFVEKYRKHYL